MIDLLAGGESLVIDFEKKQIFLKNKEEPKDQLEVFFNRITKNKFIDGTEDLRNDS
jgi:hypothetical protein